MREAAIAPYGAPGEPDSRARPAPVMPHAGIGPRSAPPTGRFGRWTMLCAAAAIWSIGGLALWLGARLVCPDGSCRVLELDRRVLGALDALRQPWLDTGMITVTWLGSIAVLLPFALVLASRHWRLGQRADASLPVLAVGGAWLLANVGKLLVARPRPDLHPALIAMPADLSFPSAHAMHVTALALACVLAPGSRPRRAMFAAAASAILVVALSRLYLQVHFPSDVAIGTIVAAAWVVGLRLLLSARA